MRLFLRKFVITILPIILAILGIEIFNRVNNTFYSKKTYIEKNRNSIEVLILGSSHTWRAINPEFLTAKCAPLAHGGSAFNIDYLLFKKFVNELPNLKVVILETSYHTFEDYRGKKWNKNHLFFVYYGINNYESTVPLSDYFLITSNFDAYVRRMWKTWKSAEFGQYNEYGFITNSKGTLERGHYDSTVLKLRHSKESPNNFKRNRILLEKIISTCEEKDLDIIFFSPPKYYTYNENNNINKLRRRNSLFNTYKKMDIVHIWNFEKIYENDTKVFSNEDHLNIYGAEKMTKLIDKRLNQIVKEKTGK